MLTLKRNRTGSIDSNSSTANDPPKYIILGEVSSIGRALKSDVRLIYPWLSRRHCTILSQGSYRYAQAHAHNSLFVNGLKSSWRILEDGDVLTIGAAGKELPDGSPIPTKPCPFIEYTYNAKPHPVIDKENIYKYEAVEGSFSLQEVVNGRLVEEFYCSEDFNETQDNIEVPDLSTVDSPPAQVDKCKTPVMARRSGRRSHAAEASQEDTRSLRSSQNSTTQGTGDAPVPKSSPKKRGRKQGWKKSTSQNKPQEGANSNVENDSDKLPNSNVENDSDKLPNSNVESDSGKLPATPAVTIDIAEPETISKITTDATSLQADESASTSKVGLAPRRPLDKPHQSTSRKFANLTPARTPNLTTNVDDSWAIFERASERTDRLLQKLDNKDSSPLPHSSPRKLDSLFDPSIESGSCSFMESMAKDDQRHKSRLSLPANIGKKSRSPKKLMLRKSGRGSAKKPIWYTEASGSESDESETETKAKTKSRKGKMADDGDDDFLPDLDDPGNAEVAVEDGDLPDIADVAPMATQSTSTMKKVTAWRLPTKKRKAGDVDEYNLPGAKARKRGRGKAPKKKEATPEITAETRAFIEKWKRPFAKKLTAHRTVVLDGNYMYRDVSFKDTQIFELIFKQQQEPNTPEGPRVMHSSYNVRLKVDVANLRQKLITADMIDEDYDNVFKLIALNNASTPSIADFDKPKLLHSDYLMTQPEEIQLLLKQYQLNTLSWMVTVENKASRGWLSCKLTGWPQSGLDLKFDLGRKRVFAPPFPQSDQTIMTLKSKGGILADQMGLGKTITLLALFAKNPFPEQRVPDPDEFKYQDNYELPSGATLVVAPSHLVGQWKEEIVTHAPSMVVHVITTKTNFEKLSYLDVMLADVVIVSVQFITTNKCFTTLPKDDEGVSAFIKLMRQPGINPLLKSPPNLYHIRWWRLVADEAHELLKYEDKRIAKEFKCVPSEGLVTLGKLKSCYRWYVTGTPFPHGAMSLRAALKFLEVEVDEKNLEHPDGSLKVEQIYKSYSSYYFNPMVRAEGISAVPLHETVLNHLYVRNTKTSIGGEYNVPEFLEELILLTMSDVERGVYDRSVSELERRKLCCHLQIAERIQSFAGVQQKSLEEVRLSLIEQARKEIQRAESSIKNYEERIEQCENERLEETKPSVINMYEMREVRYKEIIKTQHDEIAKHTSAMSYFDNIVPRINHSADEPCVICLENIEQLAVTPCGHLFCRNCILPCIRTQRMCPTCRHAIFNEEQIIEVKDAKGREELNKSTELRALTEKYGTKMAFLIFYLRNLFTDKRESRVIIFSQWDNLLHKIGETLNENGLNNVFVKGNVHVRNKAIQSFRKQDKTRVIMLSLQNAASGTNLVEATHVVLIDPVAGSKEEAIAIESQAIGRAHRMGQHKQISVVRMIMKDTIEHELYLRNNSEDIAQVEFDFDKNTTFGGPQIARTIRKVPDPDPAVLRTALENLLPDEPRVTIGRARAGGFSRRRRDRYCDWEEFETDRQRMLAIRSFVAGIEDDIPHPDSSYSDEDEDDGENNCTLS